MTNFSIQVILNGYCGLLSLCEFSYGLVFVTAVILSNQLEFEGDILLYIM